MLVAEALWPKARRHILGRLLALLEELKRYRDSQRYQQVQATTEARSPPSPSNPQLRQTSSPTLTLIVPWRGLPGPRAVL